MSHVVIVDADSMLFSSTVVCEEPAWTHMTTGLLTNEHRVAKRWMADGGEVTYTPMNVEPIDHALANFKSKVEDLERSLGIDSSEFVFIQDVGGGNFRREMYPDYKENRRKSPPKFPSHMPKLKEFLTEYEAHFDTPKSIRADFADEVFSHEVNVEADDICCMLSMALKETKVHHTLAHVDKDLDQAFGWHYNYWKGKQYTVSTDEAFKNRIMQAMVGDSADGVKGIPGFGPAKFAKWCPTNPTWSDVHYKFLKEGLDTEYFRKQVRLTHMLHFAVGCDFSVTYDVFEQYETLRLIK
jgi:hypothetical protein